MGSFIAKIIQDFKDKRNEISWNFDILYFLSTSKVKISFIFIFLILPIQITFLHKIHLNFYPLHVFFHSFLFLDISSLNQQNI